jgi:hypothetical protein
MVTDAVYSEHTAYQPCYTFPVSYIHGRVLVHSQPECKKPKMKRQKLIGVNWQWALKQKGIKIGYLYYRYLCAPVTQYKVRCSMFYSGNCGFIPLQSNKILIFLGVISELCSVVFVVDKLHKGAFLHEP